MSGLTHFDAAGNAVMVDVGDKPETQRAATARAEVVMLPATLAMIVAGQAKKAMCSRWRNWPGLWRPSGRRI